MVSISVKLSFFHKEVLATNQIPASLSAEYKAETTFYFATTACTGSINARARATKAGLSCRMSVQAKGVPPTQPRFSRRTASSFESTEETQALKKCSFCINSAVKTLSSTVLS